jgi:hypothetical protein
MGQAPLVFKLLLCKIRLEMGIHQYQTNYSSSFSGSESTHGCHRAVKLASFISVYSVYNCMPLKSLSPLSLSFSSKYSTSEQLSVKISATILLSLEKSDTDYVSQT